MCPCARSLLATLASLLPVGCTSAHSSVTFPTARDGTAGASHRSGDTAIEARAYYGVPILQKSLLWDGNGETDDAGLGVHVLQHLADDFAIGMGLNVGNWFIGGADAQSGEIEGLMRLHPFENLPFFFDLSAGYQLATEPVPPGGTDWNFTFGFGPGVEFPVDRGCSLELGALYHHVSNALGRMNDRNPSQNEGRFWIGFVWTL